MDNGAADVHGILDGEDPHFDMWIIHRDHGDVKDRFVETLCPVDVGSWDLEPTNCICENHGGNVVKFSS
jgi:hypothetical protein